METELTYYSDKYRHLICLPYSIPNLHKMAEDLGIKRCWFHPSHGMHHYDIPKRRIKEIMAKTTVIHGRELVFAIKNGRLPKEGDRY